jgi:hypothetical protein
VVNKLGLILPIPIFQITIQNHLLFLVEVVKDEAALIVFLAVKSFYALVEIEFPVNLVPIVLLFVTVYFLVLAFAFFFVSRLPIID